MVPSNDEDVPAPHRFTVAIPGRVGNRHLPLLMAGAGTTLPETNLLLCGAVPAPGKEATA